MNKRRRFPVFVFLLVIGLANCGGPSPTPPLAPTTEPSGEITIGAGKALAIRAEAAGAARYEWNLQGKGDISATTGNTILYTAPDEGDTVAMLAVTAYNDYGASPSTSLIINVPKPPPTGSIKIIPTVNTGLVPGVARCPIEGAQGEIRTTGELELNGLEPEQTYYLTLNGKPGVLPNDKLCSICEDAGCSSASGCWWDFMSISTDDNGAISNAQLVAILPPSMSLFAGEIYDVKFFVKNAAYCTVLGSNNFTFMIEQQ